MEFKRITRSLALIALSLMAIRASEDDAHPSAHPGTCSEPLDPFHEIQETLNVTTDDLAEKDLDEMVEHVMERFDCHKLDCKCIKVPDILTSGGLSAPVKEDNLSSIAVTLLHKLQSINTTCSGEGTTDWSDWWFKGVLADGHPHELEEFLEKLKDQQKESEEHEGDHDENDESEEDHGAEHGDHEEEDHGAEHGDHEEHSEEEGENEEHDHEHGESEEDHNNKQTKCFDVASVMSQAGIMHGDVPTHHQRESVANLIVLYLIRGYQIGGCPPDTGDFLDGIWTSLNLHGDEPLKEKEFDNLLSKLKIGSATGDGDGHSDAEGEEEHAHDHRRKREAEKAPVNKCFSGAELMSLHQIPTGTGVRQADLVTLCPALVQQQLSGVCTGSRSEDAGAESEDDKQKRIGVGLACILIISLGSLFGVFIIPCLAQRTQLYVMCLFIGLAVGTLVSDALLHLVPEALGLHAHAHSPGEERTGVHVEPYFWKALVIVGGIYLFFLTETILTYFGGSHHHQHHSHEHHDMEQGQKYANGHAEKLEDSDLKKSPGFWEIKSMAWMIILGDAVHNLADGLAVGAAFSLSVSSGVATSIAVFCHELPHEVGDFAVLVNSGMSYCKAALFNFISALTAVVGFTIAMLVSTDEESRRWIFTLAAGMFLYIALSDMIPELVMMKNDLRKKRSQWLCCFLLQNLGILLGVGAMVLIGLYEEDLHNINL